MNQSSPSVEDFKYSQTLNFDDFAKSLIMLGSFETHPDQQGILILKKLEFPPFDSQPIDFKGIQKNQYFQNDKYSKYTVLFGSAALNNIDCELIFPASKADITKYTKDPTFKIQVESKDIYDKFMAPYVAKNSTPERLKWISNIFDRNQEAKEEILYQQTGQNGFLIVRDYAFKPSSKINNLHVLAIIEDDSLRSLRDLNEKHVPLLKELLEKGRSVVSSKYGVALDQLKIFLHYPPSFYHLHVHFQHIEMQGCFYRNHVLSSVINNIQLKNDYYQTIDLTYLLNDKMRNDIYPQ